MTFGPRLLLGVTTADDYYRAVVDGEVHLAASGTAVVAVWNASSTTGIYPKQLVMRRSTDRGATFQPVKTLDDGPRLLTARRLRWSARKCSSATRPKRAMCACCGPRTVARPSPAPTCQVPSSPTTARTWPSIRCTLRACALSGSAQNDLPATQQQRRRVMGGHRRHARSRPGGVDHLAQCDCWRRETLVAWNGLGTAPRTATTPTPSWPGATRSTCSTMGPGRFAGGVVGTRIRWSVMRFGSGSRIDHAGYG